MMALRTVKAKYRAEYEPIGDLLTYRAMPTRQVPMNLLDPFIFLNHHGWQKYERNNQGLPFGPHPHRGFETVTFILEGDLTHKDSSGASSVIKEGGIQWMTAGSGLVHAEISSEEFKREGGPLEILQLWVNLPAKHKMTPPKYTGLQSDAIPTLELSDEKVILRPVSGTWADIDGPIGPLTDVALATAYLKTGGKLDLAIPPDHNILFYVIKGNVTVNGQRAAKHELVHFKNDGDHLAIEAHEDTVLLLGHATPFREPIVAYGPFVMNTREEIAEAYEDYRNGKFGSDVL